MSLSKELELRDVLVVELNSGHKADFEVVGLVQDEDDNNYAVAYCEKEDEFIVTTAYGDLLKDDALAQEILDDFFVLAEQHGEH